MEKIVLISAYIDKALYASCVTENPFVRDDPSCVAIGFDNSSDNLAVPVHYNRFLDEWDYNDAAWFVFCHSDWELRENLAPLLCHLDRNTLYGPLGAILYDNGDGSFTREYRGQCFEKKRDGSNERLQHCSIRHTGALVDTFDGQCFIVHSSLIARYQLRFDENLHFDLYVEDFCVNTLEKHDIKSRILNVRCCHWSPVAGGEKRQQYHSDLAYINQKYPGICRTGTASLLGGASQVVESLCRHILPQIVRFGHDDDPQGKIYHIEVNPDKPNDSKTILFHYVSRGSVVLDVGCACGDLGIALKRFKQCDVHGFEYHPTSIDIARDTGAYTKVHQTDLNGIEDNAYPEYFGKFDAIVFGDVLEHLYNPEETMRKLLAYLKPGGFLLLSIPNVAHASIIANLLRGDFSYTEIGLLDKTHVRFFTRRSIPVFLARNRLVIREHQYAVLPIQGFQSENPYPHLPAAVMKTLFDEPHSFVCQYVIKAQLDEIGSFDDCLAKNTMLHTLDENANPYWKLCRDQAFAQYPAARTVHTQAGENTGMMLHDAARYAEFITLRNVLDHTQKSPDFVPLTQEKADFSGIDVKLIAFYLPQFHAFSLNDQWFGKGFTEWTNVTRAIHQYVGHYQPRQPIDMGFYNLNDINVMKRQVELAKLYGIHAFCFHYYWFSGTRLMEKPIFNWLRHPEIDFPFCLNWANENWSKRWDGGNEEVLYKQELLEGDDEKFFADILPFFRDPRYIKIDGKPLFLIYRPHLFPKERCLQFTRVMRELADKHGFPGMLLLAVNSYGFEENPAPYGLDGIVEFPIHGMGKHGLQSLTPNGFVNPFFEGIIADGADYVKQKRFLFDVDFKLFKGVCPGWDCSPRKAYSRALVIEGITPALYKEWLVHCLEYTRKRHVGPERLIFINAWNEWGERAYLEPDSRYGYAYLQATREALLWENEVFENADQTKKTL
jgi:2-polyprenyl-3-methyl-5-hydroxy-6-metoxy-1,4-benzoquinol methylase